MTNDRADSDESWSAWRRLVIKAMQDGAVATEKLEGRVDHQGEQLVILSNRPAPVYSEEDQKRMADEHRVMYQWFGLAKVLVPVLVGVLVTIAGVVARSLFGG